MKFGASDERTRLCFLMKKDSSFVGLDLLLLKVLDENDDVVVRKGVRRVTL
jgi:hypothetical protein